MIRSTAQVPLREAFRPMEKELVSLLAEVGAEIDVDVFS